MPSSSYRFMYNQSRDEEALHTTYVRQGGIKGGGVSHLSTVINPRPGGANLDGTEGGDGMRRDDGSGGYSHGLDAGHQKAGVQRGVMVHGTGGARGGYHHCMADGCGYKTRNRHAMSIHATKANKKHALSQEPVQVGSSKYHQGT